MYLINKESVWPQLDECIMKYHQNHDMDLLGYFPCGNKDYGYITTSTNFGDVVPVYIFCGENYCTDNSDFFFDDEDYKNPTKFIEEYKWILMFYGCDNSSYGMRFKQRHDAINFINRLDVADFSDFADKYIYTKDPAEEMKVHWWNS